MHPKRFARRQIQGRRALHVSRPHGDKLDLALAIRVAVLILVRAVERFREPVSATGPSVLELDGATCWVPPGWVGARDGTTLVLTRL